MPTTIIIATPAQTGWGAFAVAEIIDSTGAPPKKEEPISAREEIRVRWSTLKVSAPAMLAVIAPNEILEPIFKQTIPRAPSITFPLNVNF